jgi:hypothetical protein
MFKNHPKIFIKKNKNHKIYKIHIQKNLQKYTQRAIIKIKNIKKNALNGSKNQELTINQFQKTILKKSSIYKKILNKTLLLQKKISENKKLNPQNIHQNINKISNINIHSNNQFLQDINLNINKLIKILLKRKKQINLQ